jgi:hypothetical protein
MRETKGRSANNDTIYLPVSSISESIFHSIVFLWLWVILQIEFEIYNSSLPE